MFAKIFFRKKENILPIEIAKINLQTQNLCQNYFLRKIIFCKKKSPEKEIVKNFSMKKIFTTKKIFSKIFSWKNKFSTTKIFAKKNLLKNNYCQKKILPKIFVLKKILPKIFFSK